MTLLALGLAGVGVLSLLNLLFAVGIVRRLREHTERLAHVGGHPAGAPDGAVAPVGAAVGAFEAQTSDGPITDEDLADGTLVAFFSPTCRPCRQKLPGFVERAAERPAGDRRLLAVVVGDADEAEPMIAALAPVVRTVQEDHEGPLTSAFAVRAFPVSARVGRAPDGRLVVTGTDVWPDAATPATAASALSTSSAPSAPSALSTAL
ncbi:hypothetical protein [Kitasatospora sp. NBC_00315]|uniref:hypothetical protein n=1 Tax=Kitasatospora sp. NBC_00315 TaxID=2975963 RepID=UPI0032544B98